MINSVVLQGRITKDLEIKTTTTGKSKLSFCIANETGFGDNKKTNFINVSCWEKLAETTTKFCGKGSMVIVRGTMSVGSYESNGEKKTYTEVVAQEVAFLDKKENKAKEDIPFEDDNAELPF